MNEKSLFIYPKQAKQLLGIGTTKFYEISKLSDFPKPKNPTGKRPMYLRCEIEAWAKNAD